MLTKFRKQNQSWLQSLFQLYLTCWRPCVLLEKVLQGYLAYVGQCARGQAVFLGYTLPGSQLQSECLLVQGKVPRGLSAMHTACGRPRERGRAFTFGWIWGDAVSPCAFSSSPWLQAFLALHSTEPAHTLKVKASHSYMTFLLL